MFKMPTAGEIAAFFGITVSILLMGVMAVLKLCGVLLLSWWWIAAPLPCVILLVIFCAVILSLFG